MEEIWKPIPEFPDYEASNLGKVRDTKNGNPRILKLSNDGTRLVVSLRAREGEKKRYTRRVHQLVMLAFVGSCPKGMEVCHNDGDPYNNHLNNLRYDTHKGNMGDAILHGTICSNPEKAKQIREEYASGLSMPAIATKHKMAVGSISRIVRGKQYPNAGGPILLLKEQKLSRYDALITEATRKIRKLERRVEQLKQLKEKVQL